MLELSKGSASTLKELEKPKHRAALQDLAASTSTEKIDFYSRMLTSEFLGSVNPVLRHAAQNNVDCPAIAVKCIPRLIRMSSKVSRHPSFFTWSFPLC